ncbi:MAG: exodeoxyribonuclease VII small subunit [Aerococcus sp.]|nr:exodeoxyribonuclease VII small subunit [Aerococcus sp.]
MAEEEQDLALEDALTRIETIINRLQSGKLPLQESMQEFQEGVKLVAYCNETLEKAENTVTQLINENDELENFDRDKQGTE